MSKLLTPDQVDQFKTDGYVSPIRVMSAADALELRKRLEEFEASAGAFRKKALGTKSHLLFSWLNDLVHNEKIVDAVEDLYGENLLCWASGFFIKNGNDKAYVSWHQDSTYWGLSKPDVVTAWVALSPSNRANGAMQVIPKTHLMDQMAHRDTFSQDNLLTRGQEVAVDVANSGLYAIALVAHGGALHHLYFRR